MTTPYPRTFRTFVTGPHNALAFNAALTVARRPGTIYNPLYIAGEVGLGKTHLLHALAAYVRARPHTGEIILTSAELFAREVQAHQGYLATLRRRYRHAGLLLIDDVDDMAGREQAAAELADLIEDRRAAERQIVLSATGRPSAPYVLPPRLHAPLRTCLIAALHAPDDTMRLETLRRLTALWEVAVPDEALTALAARLRGSVGDLVAALAALADAAASGRALTPAVARQVAAAVMRTAPPRRWRPQVEAILQAVCDEYIIPRAVLLGKSREMPIAQARQVAMYLLEDGGLTATQTGRELGRDHSTVLYGHARIAQALATGDLCIATTLDAIRRSALPAQCA